MKDSHAELTPEEERVIAQVEKLLRLAARNPNQNEAASATAKAQELLALYNLDMETVEQNSEEKGGKRVDQALKGGHFQFQRDLWEAVAKLNFCLYWSQTGVERKPKWIANSTRTGLVKTFTEKTRREHRVVGRTVNARMTQVMAEYLEEAIDRALRERCDENNEQFRGKWANSFREGAAANLVDRLKDRRAQMLDEERQKKREAAAKAAEAGHAAAREGVGTGTAITLASMTETEKDANMDFLYGEGWSADQRRQQAEAQQERARRRAESEAYWQKWREENPEEAARMDEERRKEREAERKREQRNAARRERYWEEHGQYSSRGYGSPYKGDLSAYYAGMDAGAKISIDQQAGSTKKAGAIG